VTCIVGVRTEDGVWIGGDRAEANDKEITIAKYPKVFRVGEFLIGWAGRILPTNLLEHAWSPPEQPASMKTFPFLATVIGQDIRKFFEERKCVRIADHGPAALGTALLAYRGGLFVLQDDFSVIEVESGYASEGDYLIAMGSLHTTNRYEIHPEERVELALQAAAGLSPFVKGPFDIECQPNEGWCNDE